MLLLGTFTAFLLFISKVTSIFDDICVVPPLECPNDNITFWLYTKKNENKPHEIKFSDEETITSAPWVKDGEVKILIHGYTGHKDFSPNPEIRPAYLKCCDHNVISVEYHNIAKEPCYMQAARNTELVGMCTAQLIDELVTKHNFQLSKFHIIGFSLGGQTAGYVANYLKSGKLQRITGLDPAMPMFATMDKKKKLDLDDAHFVDVLHTNCLAKGKLEACGHVDFYANGGLTQPGCRWTKNHTKSGCDHARAPAYFAESIITETGFYATRCYSWLSYIMGWCNFFLSSEEILYGEYASTESSGIYFFNTNSESPYAQGSTKREKRSIFGY